jgi:hypothetical protein
MHRYHPFGMTRAGAIGGTVSSKLIQNRLEECHGCADTAAALANELCGL